MKRAIILTVLATLVIAPLAIAQGEAEHKSVEDAMAKAATLGEHHQHLTKLTGEYSYTGKAWMAPGAPPVEWSGERSAEMVMDGRFLRESVTGDFMGQPFEGFGYMAYDNSTGQYVSTWFDNMSTGITTSYGVCSKEGWAMAGEHFNPTFGQTTAFRMVLIPEENGDFVFEWYEEMPDGTESKTMVLSYVKKN